jgi:hypothetical protein
VKQQIADPGCQKACFCVNNALFTLPATVKNAKSADKLVSALLAKTVLAPASICFSAVLGIVYLSMTDPMDLFSKPFAFTLSAFASFLTRAFSSCSS